MIKITIKKAKANTTNKNYNNSNKFSLQEIKL